MGVPMSGLSRRYWIGTLLSEAMPTGAARLGDWLVGHGMDNGPASRCDRDGEGSLSGRRPGKRWRPMLRHTQEHFEASVARRYAWRSSWTKHVSQEGKRVVRRT